MVDSFSNEPRRIHIWVTGCVQGVGFRSFVQQSGIQLDLTGWVRNVGYDTVEAVAEGPHDKLDKFVELVKTGPHSARIDEARVEWELFIREYNHFDIKYVD
jgi:acylphosphatase